MCGVVVVLRLDGDELSFVLLLPSRQAPAAPARHTLSAAAWHLAVPTAATQASPLHSPRSTLATPARCEVSLEWWSNMQHIGQPHAAVMEGLVRGISDNNNNRGVIIAGSGILQMRPAFASVGVCGGGGGGGSNGSANISSMGHRICQPPTSMPSGMASEHPHGGVRTDRCALDSFTKFVFFRRVVPMYKERYPTYHATLAGIVSITYMNIY